MFGLEIPLKVKPELGPVEVITAITAVSVAVSAAFNLGYFAELHETIASWMSVQDLLFGAAVAFVPTMLAAQVLVWLATQERGQTAPKVVGITVGIVVVVLIFFAAVADTYPLFDGSSRLGTMAGYAGWSLGLGLAFAIGSYNLRTAHGAVVTLFACFLLPYNVGKMVYFGDTSTYRADVSISFKDKEQDLVGEFLKTTSNTTFVFNGTNVIAIRNDEIASTTFFRLGGVK